jgi:hypothetical protein
VAPLSATELVRAQLDAFIRGELAAEALLQHCLTQCDAAPDLAWEVLAQLDQYHRRGKFSAELLRTFRHGIERRLFGIPEYHPAERLPDLRGGNPVAPERPAGEASRTTPECTAALEKLQGELAALRCAILREQDIARRYRRRIALLAAYGRRMRRLRANADSAAKVFRSQVQRLHAHGIRHPEPPPERRQARLVVAPAARGPERAAVQPWRRGGQMLIGAAILCGVAASRDLRGLASDDAPVALRRAADSVAPLVGSAATAVKPAQSGLHGRLSLSASRYIVTPGERSARIRIDRSGGADGDVSVVVWTRAAGARWGRDYLGSRSRAVRLAAGETSAQLAIPIVPNPARRHTELFYVGLSRPGRGASLGPITFSTVVVMRTEPAQAAEPPMAQR